MGGLPKTAMALAASQATGGVHEVALFFSDTSRSEHELKRVYGHFPGFDRVHRFPLSSGPVKNLLPFSLNRALSAYDPDVIHTHGLWEPILAYAHGYGLKNKVPYVVFPQSMLHPWQSKRHKFSKGILKHVLGWRKRWKQSAFVQVLSKAEAAHWKEEGIQQTRLIPNGIFASEDLGPGEMNSVPLKGKPFILSMARLHPQKAPDVLLEAFANLAKTDPTIHLVLAGPDYGMKGLLEKRIRELGLEDRVFLPGCIEGKEKWAMLHACSCFCLPSRAEGFSLALLEAALAGVPLVFSPECYFDALVEVGAVALARVTADDLSRVLQRVMEEKPLQMEAGRKLVLEAYQWEDISQRLLKAYEEVLH